MRSWLCSALLLTSSMFVLAEDAPKSDNMLKPIGTLESWRFEQHEGGKGAISVDGDTVTFSATEIDGTDWHIQTFQTGLDLKAGEEFTFSFEAKSAERRAVIIVAGVDEEDYHEIGLHEEISAVPPEYKKYEYTFEASNVAAAGKNRIGFVLGTEKGAMTLKNVVLKKKAKS